MSRLLTSKILNKKLIQLHFISSKITVKDYNDPTINMTHNASLFCSLSLCSLLFAYLELNLKQNEKIFFNFFKSCKKSSKMIKFIWKFLSIVSLYSNFYIFIYTFPLGLIFRISCKDSYFSLSFYTENFILFTKKIEIKNCCKTFN